MQPLIKLNTVNINTFIPLNDSEDINYQWENEDIESIQQIQIIQMYKQKVKNVISSIIAESTNNELEDILIYIYEDINKKNFGEIHSIEIELIGYLKEEERIEIIREIAKSLEMNEKKILLISLEY